MDGWMEEREHLPAINDEKKQEKKEIPEKNGPECINFL